MDLSLSSLKACGAIPHYFGLGFIQLKIDDERRLHFWVPDWPVIPGSEIEIHNHRYEFTSTILRGALDQVVYRIPKLEPAPFEGAMEVAEVSCKPGISEAPQVVGFAVPEIKGAYRIGAGSHYSLSPDDFHVATSIGSTITEVRRGPVVRDKARVIRPVGAASTCPFSLDKGEAACWDKIAEMLSD